MLFSGIGTREADVNHAVTKATMTFNFLEINIKRTPRNLREAAYSSSIRPVLKYAPVLWDPLPKCLCNRVEKGQSMAARFAFENYSRGGSITEMKSNLG